MTDLVRDLGATALATRLKRVSDKMAHSARLMYRELGIDMEPNWFLVLSIVEEDPEASVMDIAARLGFTHQSIITMTRKMTERGMLRSAKDGSDRRRTVFQLTAKARKTLPEVRRIWECGTEAILESLEGDTSILAHLDTLESNLDEASFGQRILDKYPRKKR